MRTLATVMILLLSPPLGAIEVTQPGHVESAAGSGWLFGPEEDEKLTGWVTVNDNVMGGVSDGRFELDGAGRLVFHGSLSLANNGGFASIRSQGTTLNLSEYGALRLMVRGDGRQYSLSVRTNFPIMAGAYYADFEAPDGEWVEIVLPWEAFEARSFGRRLWLAPPVNQEQIRSMGFIIADKQEGPFRLEVDTIEAVSEEPGAPAPGGADGQPGATATRLISAAISRGVPLFNDGQPEACAAVYELTALFLSELPKQDLPAAARDAVQESLRQAALEEDPVRRAWTLRYGLDAAWQALTRVEVTQTPAPD